jgi:hypothetical protein
MSTVERTRPAKILPPLVNGQHLDQPAFHERYEAMPPQTRAELVGGVVHMPSPMRLDHGKPVGSLLAGYFNTRVILWVLRAPTVRRSSWIGRASRNPTTSS